jgi:two-component system, LytTR family, response regulator
LFRSIIIDDEILALEGLADLLHLEGDFEIKAMFENPRDVLPVIDSLDIDVVFMDIDMPYINGIDLAYQIIEKKPEVEIVFVTAYESYTMAAIKTGAAGYVVKPPDPESLKRVVKQINRRTKTPAKLTGKCVQLHVVGFGPSSYTSSLNNTQLAFPTAKSEELFFLLLQQRGKMISRDEIIDKLWGDFVRDKAINNFHVNSYYLRQCLNNVGMGGQFRRDRNGYVILMDNITYDVWEFEKLRQFGYTLEEAIAHEQLYKGEFLVDKDYTWGIGLRENYEKKYNELLSIILRCMNERNDYNHLIYYYKKAIDRDPLNEEYYIGLLNVYSQTKQHQEIKELYRKIKSEYNNWLGISPPKSILDFIKSKKPVDGATQPIH